MNPISDLLAAAGKAGVHLMVVDGGLRCRCRAGALTPELSAALKAHKPAIIAALIPRLWEPDWWRDYQKAKAARKRTWDAADMQFSKGWE